MDDRTIAVPAYSPKHFGYSPDLAPSQLNVDLEAANQLISRSWRQGGTHIPCFTGPSRDLRDSWEVWPESFTAMVIADLLIGHPEQRSTVNSMLAMLEQELTSEGLFHFFKDHERLPADADCTALGLSVLLRGGALVTERAHAALDRIANNCSSAGVVETYFDPSGERSGIVDPVVCANVLYLAFQLGREDEFEATVDYLREVLVTRRYLQGTRYYHSPDTFLYFATRFVRRFQSVHGKLSGPLREALRDRHGATDHPLDLAQRVICAQWMRMDDGGESDQLLSSQEVDGCWAADSLFRYGRKKIYFGSRVLTTAFALRGLRVSSSNLSSQRTAPHRPKLSPAQPRV